VSIFHGFILRFIGDFLAFIEKRFIFLIIRWYLYICLYIIILFFLGRELIRMINSCCYDSVNVKRYIIRIGGDCICFIRSNLDRWNRGGFDIWFERVEEVINDRLLVGLIGWKRFVFLLFMIETDSFFFLLKYKYYKL
jgi:hypothetical protein